MPQWLVIGISGVTCGGKTTLAHSLREYFQSQRNAQLWNIGDVLMFSQDDYFLPVDDLRHKWNDKLNAINFELITSLDMKQMLSDLTWIMKSNWNIAVDSMENNYDYYHQNHFNHHKHYHSQSTQRHSNIMHVNSQMSGQIRDDKINILIIEGFMIFNQPELLKLCNIKFHFHLPYEKCFDRRRKRIYDPPDCVGYFEMCVWPHYEKNFSDFRERKDITFLNGEISKEKICKFVVQQIIAYLEERFDFACPPPQKLLGVRLLPSCNNDSIPKICPMEQQ